MKRVKRKESLVLIGGGGHAKVVIDAILKSGKHKIIGIVDSKLKVRSKVLGFSVIGNDAMLPKIYKKGVKKAFIGIGSIGDSSIRERLYKKLKDIGFKLAVIIHPSAVVASGVKVGEGAFIAASSTINPGSVIGKNAIINTSSSIDHDCRIGDFVHIAPGVILSGGVEVGNCTHVGTSASVIQYRRIGKNCGIPAGETVREDVLDNTPFNSFSGISYAKKMSNKKIFIIAEAGVNHNGSLRIAKELVDVAKDSGANAVKFQTFCTNSLASKHAEKAGYQKSSTPKKESQVEMLKRLELDFNAHKDLIRYCKQRDIQFLSSPFDLGSINMLKKLGLDIFKIPSGEITNRPYLEAIGKLHKKVLISTGMSDLKEIGSALDILVESGTLKKDITVLHCNTEYPTPIEDVNLSAMVTIRNTFGVKVGYSDHTLGIEMGIAAAALGAAVIEKHITLTRTMAGPDHKSSLEPGEFKAMVNAIRNVERAVGSGVKVPSNSEIKNKQVVRKSLVALKAINKDDIFSEENITTKRPGMGINPMLWNKVVGKPAKRNFKEDELIEL